MALINCPECGKEISSEAEHCIYCGYPIKKKQTQMRSQTISYETQTGKQVNHSTGPQIKYICNACGTANDQTTTYCSNCGCKLVTPYTYTGNNSNKNYENAYAPYPGATPTPLNTMDDSISPQKGKVLQISIIALLAMIALGIYGSSSIFGKKSNNTDSTVETLNTEEMATPSNTNEQENTDSTQNMNEDDTKIASEPLQEIDLSDYKYITNADLQKYCANLIGVKIYTVIDIDDTDDGIIQSTLDDGYMMSSFDIPDDQVNNFAEGDIVGICGEVNDYQDYGIMGLSVELTNCQVFATGSSAESYQLDTSDSELAEYLTVTEAVANTTDDITAEEYINLCNELPYTDILRNEDNYKGKYCELSGTVDQIIEGWFDTYTIYIVDGNDDKWECIYTYKDDESHLLEGDHVTFYGECRGTTTSTTLAGKQVIMPCIDVEYID